MKKPALLMIGLAGAAAFSCGRSDFSAVNPGPAPPTVQRKLMLMPMILFDDATLQGEVLRHRASIEELGLKVSDSGAAVVWPPAPAAGYLVRNGNRVGVTRPDGSLPGWATADQPVEVAHPSTPDRKFTLDPARVGDSSTLVLPVPFDPCMSEGDFCGPGAAPKQSEEVRPRGVPTKVVRLPRGTYPLQQGRDLNCEDENGPLAQFGAQDRKLLYLGSTCDGYVRQGACVNENIASNILYDGLMAADFATFGLISTVSNAVNGRLLDPYVSLPVNPLNDISCYENHAARVCEMIETSDLSCDAPERGILVHGVEFTSTPMRVLVEPGRLEPFVLHNNGLWGYTVARQLHKETGGQLVANFRPTAVQRLDAPGVAARLDSTDPDEEFKIEHADPRPPQVPKYHPDRNFTYIAPPGAKPGSTDVYEFQVDHATVEVTFEVAGGPVPTVSPSTDPGDYDPEVPPIEVTPLEFQETHRVGVDPCPDPLGVITVRNNGDATIDVDMKLDQTSFLILQPSGRVTLPPGQQLDISVAFNCGTQVSFTNFVYLEFPDAKGNPSPQFVRFQVNIVR